MNLGIFLIILTLVLTSLVVIYVAIRKQRSEVQTSYLVLISFFALWALFTLFVEVAALADIALVFKGLTYVLGLGIAWSFLGFTINFPYRAYQINTFFIKAGILVTTVFLGFLFLVPGTLNLRVIIDEQFGQKLFSLDYRWLTAYILVFVSISSSAFYILLRKYFTASGESRLQLRLVVVSTMIAFLAGLVFNLLSLYIDQHWLQIYGPSFTLVFTLVVAYLIFLRGRK